MDDPQQVVGNNDVVYITEYNFNIVPTNKYTTSKLNPDIIDTTQKWLEHIKENNIFISNYGMRVLLLKLHNMSDLLREKVMNISSTYKNIKIIKRGIIKLIMFTVDYVIDTTFYDDEYCVIHAYIKIPIPIYIPLYSKEMKNIYDS